MDTYKDGRIAYHGCKIYYKVFGSETSKKTPLLVLHGGPGSAHNYMLNLAKLSDERQVIFYDQIGGGLSERPEDGNWTMKLFLGEVRAIREQLNLSEIHLLGHSWGGMLAIEYLLQKPAGVMSAVLASAMISMPLYQQEVDKLKADLSPETYKTLLRHEAAGTPHSKEYQAAMAEYTKRHIYRGKRYPDEFKDPKGSFCTEAYEKLWGISEAWANGSLKDWDRISRLSEIRVPTLITSGQYDELTPQQAVIAHDNIPGSRLRIFTTGSHLAHVELGDEYAQTIRDFLASVDN
jgi:proline iminopeptidase